MSISINNSEKIRILSKIESEVSDFHPLLHNLFSKLPRVSSVINTHGPSEKGADLIIERPDDATGQSEHIAVIAKIGKIGKNINYSGIADQIEDCFISRPSVNGKKIISFDTIWVVTNSSISDPAREKIFEKYKASKVTFWDVSTLIDAIDRHFPDYWNEIPIGVSIYLDEFKRKLLRLSESAKIIPGGGDEYSIDLEIDEMSFEYGEKARRNINIFNEIAERKTILIEAHAGFGKSTTLLKIGSHFAAGHNYNKYKLVPILFHCGEVWGKQKEEIIKITQDRIKGMENDEGRRPLLLVDGMDECVSGSKSDVSKAKELLVTLDEMNGIKCVVATRPFELSERHPELIGKFRWLTIRPLSNIKLAKFFGQVCNKNAALNKIHGDINKSDLFKQIPKSPIAAVLMACLLKETKKELPSNLTELYLKFTELMLGRWDAEKGLSNVTEFESTIAICCGLAQYFFDNQLTWISIDEALSWFDRYLDERNLGIDSIQLFDKVCLRSGILIKDPERNRISFKHRTFIEFLCAYGRHRRGSLLEISDHALSPYLKNCYFFQFGLIKDASQFFPKLLEINCDDDIDKYFASNIFPEYCLAAFTTPYAQIESVLDKSIRAAASLYCEIKDKKVTNPFSNLPQIPLLYVFQANIRDSLSFQFFEKALLSIEKKIIVDDEISKDEKFAIMFFIAVTKCDLKLKSPFDEIILLAEGDEMPFLVQLAVHYEGQNVESTTLMNRAERKFRKVMSGSGNQFKEYLVSLRKTPISKLG